MSNNSDSTLQQLGFLANIPQNNRSPKTDEFELEHTTVWSFPQRATWATHKSDYRGNFAPQVARNLILTYSQANDMVLDPMVGSGTTLIEARLLGRQGQGYDINPRAVELTSNRLQFEVAHPTQQRVQLGDVRAMQLPDESVNLIITHPPYANIIKYSDGKNPADLSSLSNIGKFFDQLTLGLHEMYRVLKPNHYCAILMGDTRKGQHYIPLSYMLLQRALEVGFILKEQVIKLQHNTRRAPMWRKSASNYKFYLIMHEQLFIFRKPAQGEKLTRLKWSMKQVG
ncbi:DNA methyltransferase [Anaerolineales bacterium HSG25]|nr:DNA methyltransferase [Anaerolineales bacterium HSG25]